MADISIIAESDWGEITYIFKALSGTIINFRQTPVAIAL